MEYLLIFFLSIVFIGAVYFYSKNRDRDPKPIIDEMLKDVNNTQIEEWINEVKNAQLSEALYEQANDREKKELLYNYTQKITYGDEQGDNSVKNMPKTLRVYYLVHELKSELLDEGFLQFFAYHPGYNSTETLESLRLIGASYTKTLLEEGLTILYKHKESPATLNEKIGELDSIEAFNGAEFSQMKKELTQLDDKFLDSKEDISALSMTYFDKNKNKVWQALKDTNHEPG